MAEPTSELIVPVLQQIQETQKDHSARFADQMTRFEKIELRLDEVHESMITARGLAGHANVRHDQVTARLDDLARRIEVLEQTK